MTLWASNCGFMFEKRERRTCTNELQAFGLLTSNSALAIKTFIKSELNKYPEERLLASMNTSISFQEWLLAMNCHHRGGCTCTCNAYSVLRRCAEKKKRQGAPVLLATLSTVTTTASEHVYRTFDPVLHQTSCDAFKKAL